jgi:hypothetical protein
MSWIITGTEKYETDPYRSQVSLLLHGDGANGSTTITDSSPTPKTVTAVGNAQISTAQSKFGGSSIAFDGNGDYLTIPASADFSFGTENFTVEFWYYHLGGTDKGLFANNSGSGVGVNFLVGALGSFRIYNGTSGGNVADFSASPALNTWQHVAVVRQSGTVTLYVNGAASGTANWAGVNAGNVATFSVGAAYGNARFANGYIDEFRVTKNIARYTSNFTPPTAPFPDIESR